MLARRSLGIVIRTCAGNDQSAFAEFDLDLVVLGPLHRGGDVVRADLREVDPTAILVGLAPRPHRVGEVAGHPRREFQVGFPGSFLLELGRVVQRFARSGSGVCHIAVVGFVVEQAGSEGSGGSVGLALGGGGGSSVGSRVRRNRRDTWGFSGGKLGSS
jgi:hypothetical protein